MMPSAVTLSGAPSRKPGLGGLACPAADARGRGISVGISIALFDVSGSRLGLRGPHPRLPGHQMPVPAKHADRLAAPRAMQRLEDARKESPALPVLLLLAFNGVSTHR